MIIRESVERKKDKLLTGLFDLIHELVLRLVKILIQGLALGKS